MTDYLPIFILLLLLAIVSLACEQTVEPVDIPFVERMVVSGIVVPGQPIGPVNVSRTIPINEVYTPENAVIDSAVVTVKTSAGTFPLQYRAPIPGVPGYYGDSSLIAQPGETYTLKLPDMELNGRAVEGLTVRFDKTSTPGAANLKVCQG